MNSRKKNEKNPVAAALGWCMQCPSEHPLREAAKLVVGNALRSNRYKQDAAEHIGVTNVFLSTLLNKHPELKPSKETRK